MSPSTAFQTEMSEAYSASPNYATKGSLILRLIRAAQPITRTEIARRLHIDKSTVTENIKPLLARGILREETVNLDGRRGRLLLYEPENHYFIGVNFGVRRSQVGFTTLRSEISGETDFETPSDPLKALKMAREHIENIIQSKAGRFPDVIGVSVPGMTDSGRSRLLFAPNLNWRDIDIGSKLKVDPSTSVVVENDSTAAAMYEARVRIGKHDDGMMTNFVLVRSGTGIGVGLVIGSEVYRGTGIARGMAGEFGHMTIVAGGKSCVCGNRGCWEKYASASSAASLYLGDRPPSRGETVPRFVEIVTRAQNGETRSRKTLEKVGDYLGIGIANVIMGVGIPRVIISGRLVYGWEFISAPLLAAIERSIVGKIDGWSVEAGEPVGAAIGGALEAAVEEYLSAVWQ